MASIRARRWLIASIALATMLFGTAVIVTSGGTPAEAGLVQGQVVPEMPRTNVPVVLDGRVLAHAQVGDRIFVGGDFQQVQLDDGTVITQPYLFAYDIDTGVLDPNFRPVLNKLVRSLEATQANDGLYVGGLFSSWDASFPLRVAKLDAQGNLDPNWGPRASARVQSIVEVGDSVYLGGDFTQVSGEPTQGLVKVDRLTGAVDTTFIPAYTSSVAGAQLVKTVKAAPDGSALYVLHYAQSVNGQTRQAVAKYDLVAGTPVLSGWNIPWVAQNPASNCWNRLRDMAISPDGSFIVIGGQGADNPPNCDSVLRYETAGSTTVNFTWSARMYSSVFSMAVSDVAVYVGGHFCAAPANPIPLGGVSSDYPGSINRCEINDPFDEDNPSVVDPANAVFRKQMAALDPTTGQALPWDPGSDNFVGVFDLTLIDRGLLAGHDRSRFNDFLVGRSGFFDFGVDPDVTPPSIDVTAPTPGSIVVDPPLLAGTANDDREVSEVIIRLRNVTTAEWLQLDGTLGETQVDLPIVVFPTGLGSVGWSYTLTSLPPGDYEVRGFSKDGAGNTSPGLASPFAVPGDQQCTVVLDANDRPEITWSGFLANNVTQVFLRRDAGFLSTQAAPDGTYTDLTAAPGDYSYLVRWRPGGVVTDVPCTPDPITVPPGGGGVTCTVGLDGSSKPVLSWTDVPGVTRYVVREAALGYVATVDNALTYTDASAVPGDYSYILRYRVAGAVLDVGCTPDPITVPEITFDCNASVNAAGEVVLDWGDVPGEDTYDVRDDDGWVASVSVVSEYIDTTPTSGDRTYVIRYRMAGQVFDITCQPTVVVP